MKQLIIIALCLLMTPLIAAVGCDLNDPDGDVRRLFPGSTGYKTSYRSIQREGGRTLLNTIETRLGDRFTGLYETIDNPYTIYEVYSGTRKIGVIHGVNQKGRTGGIQIFLALDNNGIIKKLYLQRISSRNNRLYRAESFTNQFIGLKLEDFDRWNVARATGTGKVAAIRNPVANDPDFAAIMRGIKKNLILMKHFSQ